MAGYESILGKVKLLLTASVQDLLNEALNANKPVVFDEQINLLQGSLRSCSTRSSISSLTAPKTWFSMDPRPATPAK